MTFFQKTDDCESQSSHSKHSVTSNMVLIMKEGVIFVEILIILEISFNIHEFLPKIHFVLSGLYFHISPKNMELNN